MASLNISINQLLEVIKGLNEIEKIQVKNALEEDFFISEEKVNELLKRKTDFISGSSSSRSWENIKSENESL
ncbi:hypothetical protein [Dyadobacter sediminis]|uniref:Addiction module protein n=1 Tax=Dyadobacter sediminis TaxID=1493691 RepID=A0A5R9K9L5_9BACT|nr:hypothetical protein [Dyadobacter sediminis]TLU90680.1 hypothetical protein FEM55_19205 [Dyadobacter sediminis]GGC09865.1 hypothetical protein GCM10011325_40910 [Dyadobacter sediminis]